MLFILSRKKPVCITHTTVQSAVCPLTCLVSLSSVVSVRTALWERALFTLHEKLDFHWNTTSPCARAFFVCCFFAFYMFLLKALARAAITQTKERSQRSESGGFFVVVVVVLGGAVCV